MSESIYGWRDRSVGLHCYASLTTLIDAVYSAVTNGQVGTTGVYYAEKLEQAAKIIRDADRERKETRKSDEQTERNISESMPRPDHG